MPASGKLAALTLFISEYPAPTSKVVIGTNR